MDVCHNLTKCPVEKHHWATWYPTAAHRGCVIAGFIVTTERHWRYAAVVLSFLDYVRKITGCRVEIPHCWPGLCTIWLCTAFAALGYLIEYKYSGAQQCHFSFPQNSSGSNPNLKTWSPSKVIASLSHLSSQIKAMWGQKWLYDNMCWCISICCLATMRWWKPDSNF